MDITMTITRSPDGTVNVNGPLQDKGVCYAMLELARDAIKDFHDKQGATPPVIVPAKTLPFRPHLSGQ